MYDDITAKWRLEWLSKCYNFKCHNINSGQKVFQLKMHIVIVRAITKYLNKMLWLKYSTKEIKQNLKNQLLQKSVNLSLGGIELHILLKIIGQQ